MTFIKRNKKELLWITLNAAAALMNLWFASWSNVWWLHAVFVAAHAICAGVWVHAVFENRKLDALQAEVDSLVADIEALEDPYLAAEVQRVLGGEVSQ
jgi:hypothetical protein